MLLNFICLFLLNKQHKIMSPELKKSDFTFEYAQGGFYKVTYAGKTRLIKEDGLLHQILNTDTPINASLRLLKDRVCKQ